MAALFRRSDDIQLLSHVRGFDVLKFEAGPVFGGELCLQMEPRSVTDFPSAAVATWHGRRPSADS